MLRTVAKVFGFVLVALGILGFIPALAPDSHLLGIFHVDLLHNIIHLASGAVALWAGYATYSASKIYFQVFGVVYALVALLGFVYGEQAILGILANNTADTWLHVVIAVAALALGFGGWGRETAKV